MQKRPHKNEVMLTEQQRYAPHQLISKGQVPAQTGICSRFALDRRPGGRSLRNESLHRDPHPRTFVTNGLEDVLSHRQHTQTRARALDGEQEVHLIALSCSPCPEGQAHWTMRLLVNRMVELGYVERVSYETVWPTLKKTNSSPNAQFGWQMEDVLDVYPRPYDACVPLICLDESGKQLVSERLAGLPMRPGKLERFDYAYEQGPMLNLFLASEPLAGKRAV